MITRSHCKAAAIGLCLALPTFAQATQILIDETFDGASVPEGWVFNGKQGTSHTAPSTGVNKTATDWFGSDDGSGNGQGFVRLTNNGTWSEANNQRTTAIYGDGTFSTMFDFSISAEVRISSGSGSTGADGLSFFWLDASSLDLVNYNLNHFQGGMGEWQGAPRGTILGTKSPCPTPTDCVMGEYYGAYNSTNGFFPNPDTSYPETSLRGYSFEFDHYANSSFEQQEYNHMVRLDDWAHMTDMRVDSTSDPDYYEDVGWVSFELAYSATDKRFTYTYTGRDSNGDPVAPKTVVLTPTVDEWTEFDRAYFGISAGTGGQYADHDVRNLIVTSEAPGPGTLALFAFAPLVAIAARRRRR